MAKRLSLDAILIFIGVATRQVAIQLRKFNQFPTARL